MDEQMKLAIAGVAIGYLTGALAIKDPITASLLGAAIGLGVGALIKSTDTAAALTAEQQAALNAGY